MMQLHDRATSVNHDSIDAARVFAGLQVRFIPPDLVMLDLTPAYNGVGRLAALAEYQRCLGNSADVFDASWYDRSLDWIFDGDPVVGAELAVLRFLARVGAQDPSFPGGILAWGVDEGLVSAERYGGELIWRRLRSEVTYVRGWPKALDVRIDAPSGGVLSRAALASREAKLRITEARKIKKTALTAIQQELVGIDGSKPLPVALADDLPSLKTIDALRSQVVFLDVLPAWRVVEIYWHIHSLWRVEEEGRRRTRMEARLSGSCPHCGL
ncbi:hypothetical protein [Devosia sp. RR2S18]|uniref:hypothetical protein n=1 Tax=Devosia rhizosphaerae TaxID=3049774 RepID=UPI00254099C0|nr:hypothetical protein [Devosia sp. RR2S18]WIJ26365.1 hypothetical protein QOV41_06280 [Devosia sp. RR2S18]